MIVDNLSYTAEEQKRYIHTLASNYDDIISAVKIYPPRDKIKTGDKLDTIALTSTAIRPNFIPYPLDKINSIIWGFPEKYTGQDVPIKAEKKGSKKEVNILYYIDFDNIGQGITSSKRLTPFDKRVYIAVSALFDANNSLITLTQIYHAMGYPGTPGANDLERINKSVTKMAGANIEIDNKDEIAAGYKYDKFVYRGPLLPLERVDAIRNGQVVEAMLHLFGEPPIISFAKQRKQITDINPKILQSHMNKTDANLLIEDYLITRISHSKHGCRKHRILFKTLYEKAEITTTKQRQRLPEKVKRYLEHFKQCDFISRYSIDENGISFN